MVMTCQCLHLLFSSCCCPDARGTSQGKYLRQASRLQHLPPQRLLCVVSWSYVCLSVCVGVSSALALRCSLDLTTTTTEESCRAEESQNVTAYYSYSDSKPHTKHLHTLSFKGAHVCCPSLSSPTHLYTMADGKSGSVAVANRANALMHSTRSFPCTVSTCNAVRS